MTTPNSLQQRVKESGTGRWRSQYIPCHEIQRQCLSAPVVARQLAHVGVLAGRDGEVLGRWLVLPGGVRNRIARGLLTHARECSIGNWRRGVGREDGRVERVEEERVGNLEDDIHGGDNGASRGRSGGDETSREAKQRRGRSKECWEVATASVEEVRKAGANPRGHNFSPAELPNFVRGTSNQRLSRDSPHHCRAIRRGLMRGFYQIDPLGRSSGCARKPGMPTAQRHATRVQQSECRLHSFPAMV